ncbi:hypothetical protein [Nonomuraea ceibae]|uniref:hypothetical protein n=1 Tax=Nonomuraea ceibae TaxID=1935170 RepID=UPI001C5D5ECC|nr:hypothetical protein [Nonomuraea ceibae]
MNQLHWTSLPEQIRRDMAKALGITAVKPLTRHAHGFTALMPVDGPGLLCKAGLLGYPTTDGIVLEQTLLPALSTRVLVPAVRWSTRQDPWGVTVVDQRAYPAVDLSPGSPDVAATMELLARLAGLQTPCPFPVPPVAQRFKAFWRTAETLLRTATLPGRSLYAQALSRFAPDTIRGDTLLHFSLSPRTLRVARHGHEGLCLTDWYDACKGPAWVEAAQLIPHLIMAGHRVNDVQDLLSGLPAWHESPPGMRARMSTWPPSSP